MDIDFVPGAKALKEINYTGYLTLEADEYLGKYTSENVFDGICELASSARRFDELMKA